MWNQLNQTNGYSQVALVHICQTFFFFLLKVSDTQAPTWMLQPGHQNPNKVITSLLKAALCILASGKRTKKKRSREAGTSERIRDVFIYSLSSYFSKNPADFIRSRGCCSCAETLAWIGRREGEGRLQTAP